MPIMAPLCITENSTVVVGNLVKTWLCHHLRCLPYLPPGKRSLRRLCFHRCLSVYRGVYPSIHWAEACLPGRHLPRRVSAWGCLPMGVCGRDPPRTRDRHAPWDHRQTPPSPWWIPRDTVTKRTVRIPLECILVTYVFLQIENIIKM